MAETKNPVNNGRLEMRMLTDVREPDHPTFNFVLREDTVPDEFKADLVSMMDSRIKEIREKKKRSKKIAIRVIAAAALLAIALFATPLGQYVTSAAEDLFRSAHSWTEDLFRVGKKGKTLEIEKVRFGGDFVFVTVKTDSEVMLHCTGEIRDNKGNVAKLYSGYDLSTRDDYVEADEETLALRYATRKQGEIMLYAPDMAKVVNSDSKSYSCSLKVSAYPYEGKLLDITRKSISFHEGAYQVNALDPIEGLNAKNGVLAGGIRPTETVETKFAIEPDKLGSVLEWSRFDPDPDGFVSETYTDDKISLKMTVKEGILYRTASNVIVDIEMLKGRSAAGRVNIPYVYMERTVMTSANEYNRNYFGNDHRQIIYGDGHYYLILDNAFFNNQEGILPYSYERIDKNTKYLDFYYEEYSRSDFRFFSSCAEIPVESQDRFSYETLNDISLPIQYDSVTGMEQSYDGISFTLTDGIQATVKGLYKHKSDLPDLNVYDTRENYYIALDLKSKKKQSFDLKGGAIFRSQGVERGTDELKWSECNMTEGMNSPTGGNTVLSAQSRGKEIFRIQAEFLPGEWTDEANNVSFNARIAFSGIYCCAEYDGHKFYNVDIENIHSLRKSDGRFLSLAGVFKKYRIDTLKIISVAYEKISYSDVRILSEDTDTMWKEITPLIRLGYSFRSRTVRSDGEFVKKPLALHTKSRKRVKALNPNYYNIGQLRKTRQTTRVSTPGVPDYERITSIG